MENLIFEKESTDLVIRARGLIVIDQESLTMAKELILARKQLKKKIQDYFAPLKSKAHAAWKEVCDTENMELAKLMPLDSLDYRVASFIQEQERKRKEAELAIIRAVQERKRIEEEALRKAQEAEARARAEKSEEARKKAQAEADAILAQAAEEEKKLEPMPTVPEAMKTPGLSARDNWDFVVEDESLIPRQYLMPDEVKIRKVVKAMKDQTDIPGIRAVNRPITSRIGRRLGES